MRDVFKALVTSPKLNLFVSNYCTHVYQVINQNMEEIHILFKFNATKYWIGPSKLEFIFLAVCVKNEFFSSKLCSRTGNCFHFLLHRRIILIWYKTRRLQVVVKIRLDLYLLVVCCSEQLLNNEHLSAGSLTKRWQKSKSYSSRSDHCRTWHE